MGDWSALLVGLALVLAALLHARCARDVDREREPDEGGDVVG